MPELPVGLSHAPMPPSCLPGGAAIDGERVDCRLDWNQLLYWDDRGAVVSRCWEDCIVTKIKQAR